MPLSAIGLDADQKPPLKQCNCKRSNCLKLYCECFATGVYCRSTCNCVSCFNNLNYENLRIEAVEAILDRNSQAFRPKIIASHRGGAAAAAGRHNRGCQCKKSFCLKKYCECFQAGIVCTQRCKCQECKNFEGSTDRADALKLASKAPRAGAGPFEAAPAGPGAPAPAAAAPAAALLQAEAADPADPASAPNFDSNSLFHGGSGGGGAAAEGDGGASEGRGAGFAAAGAGLGPGGGQEEAGSPMGPRKKRRLTNRHALSRILCDKTVEHITTVLHQAASSEAARIAEEGPAPMGARERSTPPASPPMDAQAAEGDAAVLFCGEVLEDGGPAPSAPAGASAVSEDDVKRAGERMASQERVILQYFSHVIRHIMSSVVDSVKEYETLNATP